MNILAQVVIKDEIILYETENPDEESLTMPFYGKVTESINTGAFTNGWLKRVVVEAGGQTVVKSCPCTGCTWIYHGWTINNLPAAMPVTVTVYSHCENGEFIEADTRVVNTGTHQYNIEYYYPNHLQWYLATTLKFIATTPPDCPNAEGNYCDDLFYIENPVFKLEEHNSSYTTHQEICSDENDVAYTWLVNTPKEKVTNLNSFTNDSLMVCFNRQTQQWKFKIIPPTIKLNVVIDLCYDKINNKNWTIVNDTTYLDTIVLNDDCSMALKSFDRHKNYGDDIPENGYLLKEVILEHEALHEKNWEKYIQNYNHVFYLGMHNLQNHSCNEFVDTTSAKNFGTIFYQSAFADYFNQMNNSYKIYYGLAGNTTFWQNKKLRREREVHNSDEVQKKIKRYISLLEQKCNNQ